MTQEIALRATRAIDTLLEDLGAAMRRAVRRFNDWRLYQRSIRELSQLGGEELSDLGLHHSEIRRVAREAVYGRSR